MKSRTKGKSPEFVFRNGKPAAVLLDIKVYQEMIEQLEDKYDLRILQRMRKKPLQFKKLGDFLKEYGVGV